MDETHETSLDAVDRVEYIDITGRVLVRRLDEPGVVLSMQDGGRTLKVFTRAKFDTFADPAAAVRTTLSTVMDEDQAAILAERATVLAELAAWDPDEEYLAELREWDPDAR